MIFHIKSFAASELFAFVSPLLNILHDPYHSMFFFEWVRYTWNKKKWMVVKCCIKITDQSRYMRKETTIHQKYIYIYHWWGTLPRPSVARRQLMFWEAYPLFLLPLQLSTFSSIYWYNVDMTAVISSLEKQKKNAACAVSVESPTMWSFINILQSMSMTHCSCCAKHAATGLKSRPCYDPAVIMSIHHQYNEYNRWTWKCLNISV